MASGTTAGRAGGVQKDEIQKDGDPYAAARSIVLRQLTASPKSRHQLAVKLASQGIPEDVAESVLDRFEEVQLIDDAEFAQLWVRSRAQTKSLARSALKRELADKGVQGELAEAALAQRSDEDERAAAVALVRRKLRPTELPLELEAGEKLTRRLVGMLARKGYSPGMAFTVVKEVLGEMSP